jgi:selenide,water dikinase
MDPRLLVGLETGDDAAAVQVAPDLAVVHTLDFFMPIVDDPHTFGRIAAANAISDVYAMGATPLVALAILGLPRKVLGPEVGAAIMEGGARSCTEAGIVIAGGHTIDDAEPKFGLSVTGTVRPDGLVRNSTGQEGDLLVLTKPLGTGALAQAIKKGIATEAQVALAVDTMCFLNRAPALAMARVGVHAATDVTGFSLLGHALEMARGAGLGVELWMDALPVLDTVRDVIAQGVHPGATGRNLAHFGAQTTWGEGVTELDQKLIADPQTSGGLLLALPEAKVSALQAALKDEGAMAAEVVGRLVAGSGCRVLQQGG